jgi:hypothetical protein
MPGDIIQGLNDDDEGRPDVDDLSIGRARADNNCPKGRSLGLVSIVHSCHPNSVKDMGDGWSLLRFDPPPPDPSVALLLQDDIVMKMEMWGRPLRSP